MITVAFIVLVLTGLFVLYFAFHNRNSLEAYQRNSGISLAQSIAHSSVLGMIAREPAMLQQSFSIAMNDPRVVFVAAYENDGSILKQNSRVDADLSLSTARLATPLRATAAYFGGTAELGGSDIDEFLAPIRYEQEKELSESILEEGVRGESHLQTVGFIRIGVSRAQIKSAVRSTVMVSFAIGALVMVMGMLLSFYMSRLITRPLKDLESGTKRISQGDLDVSLEISSDDEVGEVAKAFNAMAGALRETTVSRDFVDNILGSMNEAMIVLDNDRKITSMNRAAEELLDYRASELSAMPIDSVFPHAEGHPMDRRSWPSLLAGGALSNLHEELRAKDGRCIPVSLSAAPIYDRAGKSRGLVCIARDMREMNALLDQLRDHAEELERYQSVLFSMLDDNEKASADTESEREKTLKAVDAMSEGLIMFAPNGEVMLINNAAKEMLGIAPGVTPELQELRNLLGGVMDPIAHGEGGGARLTQDIALGKESPRTLRFEGINVEHEGKFIGYMLVMRDITRQRQLDEAKYELIANVSHELRTPLAIISNVISNALVGVTGPLTDKLKDGLNMCSNSTKRLSHIIDNLLDVAAVDAGKVSLRRERVDLAQLVKEKVAIHEEEARGKGVILEVSTGAERIVTDCDAKAIGDVLANLIANAIHFTNAGGMVSVAAARHGSHVEVSVTDTGVGIPPAEQASIFERFHQYGRTYGPGEKGVGLGLSISRQLVEQHGGSIGVTSIVGRGSRFYFLLPLKDNADKQEVT